MDVTFCVYALEPGLGRASLVQQLPKDGTAWVTQNIDGPQQHVYEQNPWCGNAACSPSSPDSPR